MITWLLSCLKYIEKLKEPFTYVEDDKKSLDQANKQSMNVIIKDTYNYANNQTIKS